LPIPESNYFWYLVSKCKLTNKSPGFRRKPKIVGPKKKKKKKKNPSVQCTLRMLLLWERKKEYNELLLTPDCVKRSDGC
jgi:hypothetical protein